MLTLRGALDADTAPSLAVARGATSGALRMIDARDVGLLAGAGVEALLELTRRRPTPVRASPPVRRTVECCDLGDLLLLSPARG